MAVFGGTFDPVHHGHLRLAVEIIEYFRLDSLRMVPAAAPNLRGAPAAGAEDRLAMVRAASGGGIEVDDREIRRAGRSYTADTLAGLRAGHGDAPLLFVLGADAATRLNHWERWRQLFDHAHLVIVNRPGASVEDGEAELVQELTARASPEPEELLATPAGRVHRVTCPLLEISASDIRARVAAGRSIRYLTPQSVIDIISQRRLYLR